MLLRKNQKACQYSVGRKGKIGVPNSAHSPANMVTV